MKKLIKNAVLVLTGILIINSAIPAGLIVNLIHILKEL